MSPEIAETIRQGQEQAGEINVEHIPLNRIDVDIDNPRRTGFTTENINAPDEVINNNPNKKKYGKDFRAWQSQLSQWVFNNQLKSIDIATDLELPSESGDFWLH